MTHQVSHTMLKPPFKFALKFALLIPLLLVGACSSSGTGEDTARDRPIREGNARFTVISPTLIRMEYAADGRFEDRPTQTVAERPNASADYETRVDNGVRIVKTAALTLHYRIGSGAFAPDNLWVHVKNGSAPLEARPDWSFAAQAGNLGGWRRGLDNEKDPQPLNEGVLSRAGWYLLNDSNTVLLTDTPPGFAARPDHGGDYQDGYLFGYGLDYVQALTDLRTLTGAAPLLPKKAFGVWFSRWWSYTDAEWRAQIVEFRPTTFRWTPFHSTPTGSGSTTSSGAPC